MDNAILKSKEQQITELTQHASLLLNTLSKISMSIRDEKKSSNDTIKIDIKDINIKDNEIRILTKNITTLLEMINKMSELYVTKIIN